ncbi:prostaglandin E2 receptor EP1 subtype-like [Hypomesus transpacificus]|uniref:prostaglandin E2 receptor EP1 subtype-like n=1 Tax=Hypomesus transpacificus TaxID=137520 RepID=UPI001F07E583|nr:prostaglandin E2 receptor EP1 subtype-like [Hypomesus transpacificus]XP_046894456.1 prostaglandin E2 receptor EP1 subtype-like [Hypomesus transpacificus]XP_046894457.1 prostaglandin E2 receptor EP1 subtype-like [Hypomesus transpacificus]XP_046894458.1 prostaglandin E2 receptor EP1 subtype-like [Hypomesus transpacificus]
MLAMQDQNSSTSSVLVHRSNASTPTPSPKGSWMVVLNMTLGMASNIVALVILAKAYARLRRRSKAVFLLFASSLVTTDLFGHALPGALVLILHSAPVLPHHLAHAHCQFLGGSLVFFGLCPLLLGCLMAAERCLGVTRPLLHTALVTTPRARLALGLVWLLALGVALLPSLGLGAYASQHPGTWCFIRVLDPEDASDLGFVLLFSGLALGSLALALVCNTVSGVVLLRARLRRKACPSRAAKSHDIEMVVQLVGIMVVSCICWSPLLIFGLMSVTSSYGHGHDDQQKGYYRGLLVTGLRLAIWNQILDPWVYILLRRAVLRRIYRITGRHGNALRRSILQRWDVSSFYNSEKK